MFDYLAARFAVYGTPADCGAQLQRAKTAGLRHVMFTVSLASDPVETIALFGEEVLPTLRMIAVDFAVRPVTRSPAPPTRAPEFHGRGHTGEGPVR